MALTLVFMGRLEDAAGAGEMQVESARSIAEVIARLDPELTAALHGDKVKIAVNGSLVSDRAAITLRDGDELAFLPPVSGG